MLSLALWLFVLEMPFTYVIFTPGYNANLFLLFFIAPIALAGLSLYRPTLAFHTCTLRCRHQRHAHRFCSRGGSWRKQPAASTISLLEE